MKKVMVALMLLLIESLLFYLYAIPTEAWAYSSVFIILIFGGWTGIDEIRKRKKCEQLKTIRKEAEVYLEMEHFGKPEDAVERHKVVTPDQDADRCTSPAFRRGRTGSQCHGRRSLSD